MQYNFLWYSVDLHVGKNHHIVKEYRNYFLIHPVLMKMKIIILGARFGNGTDLMLSKNRSEIEVCTSIFNEIYFD